MKLPAAAAAARVPLRTAQRWLTRFCAQGLNGLAQSPRSDRRGHRLPQELQLLIEGLALCRPAASAPFVVTKEFRRLAEFADAVGRDQYIGLGYGPPGVGKTLSARRYASWDLVEPAVRDFKFFQCHPDRHARHRKRVARYPSFTAASASSTTTDRSPPVEQALVLFYRQIWRKVKQISTN